VLAYFGTQRVEKYPADLTSTELTECKRINLVDSTASIPIPDKIKDVFLDDQTTTTSETLIAASLSSNSLSWTTSTHIELTLSTDFWVTNKCGFLVGDLLLARSKNLLNQAPVTFSNNLNTAGMCPDGTTKVIPNGALDISYALVDHTFQSTTKTDFTNFIRMQTNSIVGELLPYEGQGFSAGQYTVKYQVGFAVSSALERSVWPPIQVVVTLVKTCDIVTPTISSDSTFRDGYTYLRGSPAPVKLTFSSLVNDDCAIRQTLTFADGTALAPASVYNYASPNMLLQSDSPVYEGSKDLKYRVESVLAPAEFFKELPFRVTILMSSCTKLWQMPSVPNLFDATYYLKDLPLEVVFSDVSLNDCPFQLSLWNVTSTVATAVDVSYIKLQQAVQQVNSQDPMRVTVSSFGRMLIQTDDVAVVGKSKLELRVVSQRYPGDAEYKVINLDLTIANCVSVDRDTEKVLAGFNYTVGDPRLSLGSVGVLNPICENSFFSIAPSLLLLPPAFLVNNATATRQVHLSVYADSVIQVTSGNYSITVTERDFYSGFTAKTTFLVNVNTRSSSKIYNVTEPSKPTAETPATPVVKTVANETKVTPAETVTVAPAFEILWDENGLPVYPWQRTAVGSKQVEPTDTIEKKEPLRARVLSLSSTGKLIIAFNKSIYKPPIRITSPQRRLSGEFQFELHEVIEIELESEFYDKGSAELRIVNYTLTNMTLTQLHIQIIFEQPSKLAMSRLDPD